jgi:hypothetical protein
MGELLDGRFHGPVPESIGFNVNDFMVFPLNSQN